MSTLTNTYSSFYCPLVILELRYAVKYSLFVLRFLMRLGSRSASIHDQFLFPYAYVKEILVIQFLWVTG